MSNNYIAIRKGTGFLYAFEQQLYVRVKTRGNIKLLKCATVGCDGSAQLDDAGVFHVKVCKHY